MTCLVNLTGHSLVLEAWDGHTVDLQSSGQVRINSEMTVVGKVEVGDVTVPLLEIREREITGLPSPVRDVIYVVSGLASAIADRDDVVTVSRPRREGRVVVSARALARIKTA